MPSYCLQVLALVLSLEPKRIVQFPYHPARLESHHSLDRMCNPSILLSLSSACRLLLFLSARYTRHRRRTVGGPAHCKILISLLQFSNTKAYNAKREETTAVLPFGHPTVSGLKTIVPPHANPAHVVANGAVMEIIAS